MKTIEQFKKDLIIELACDDDTLIRCAVNETIKFAQRWISIDDELPESPSTVLFSNKTHTLMSTGLFEKGSFYPDWNTLEQKNITHWRPIELK